MAEWVGAGLVGLLFAVAGLLAPEAWFPWVLMFAGWLMIWTGAAKLAEVSQSWTQANLQRVKSFLDSRWRYAANVLLCLGVVVLIRFAVFGTIDLQKTALDPALPGDDVKVTGEGFPVEHPKILVAKLEPKDTSHHEREGINKGVAANVFTVGLPADLEPGDYELVIDGPMGWPGNLLAWLWLGNRAKIELHVLGQPKITSVTPAAGFRASGNLGTRVAIHGENFDLRNHGSANRVYFGGAEARPVHADDATECGQNVADCVVAFVPGEAPDGKSLDLTIETSSSPQGKSKAVPFHVLGPPSIDQAALAGVRGFAKTKNFAGSVITIKGQGFYPAALDDPGGMTVTIDGKAAEILNAPTETEVRVRIPADVADGRIEIVTAARVSSKATGSIDILKEPVIKDWKPWSASPGERVDLVGTGFDVSDIGNNRVTIGGAVAKVAAARTEGDVSILTVIVPGLAESGELVVETPAGASNKATGIQVKPVIDNIEPKPRYVGETVFVHGRGLLRDAAAEMNSESNPVPMRQVSFAKEADGQVIGFEVPPGAVTSPITLHQGSGVSVISADSVTINRAVELQQMTPYVSRPITYVTPKGKFILQVACDEGLQVKDAAGQWLKPLPVGRCPIDLDVDHATARAYTANVKEDAKEGISEIHISDPTTPKFLRHIDSGGANPTRVRLIHGGGIVAATNKGIFNGDARSGLRPSGVEGPVVAMIGDAREGQFVTAIVQSPPRAAVFRREGEPRVVGLKDTPKAAAPAGNKIYIVNFGSDNLTALDPRAPDKPTSVPLKAGAKPFDLVSHQGPSPGRDELYVTETGLKQVAAIDSAKDSAIEFGVPLNSPTLAAFSPDGCVAVIYDVDKGAFAKIDPRRRVAFDSVQSLRSRIDPPPIALRIDDTFSASFLLKGGSILPTSYQASCPR
jgi:DNA-binding beta-propeller fold protein YncE